MSTLDELNEVVESLFKSGTRYRSEKIIIVGLYLVVTGVSAAWVFAGMEKLRGLDGEFESHKLMENIDDQNFTLANVGGADWHEVRVAVNDRFLVNFEKIKAESTERLNPEDFKYFYHIPRPWGHAKWERLEAAEKPGQAAPGDLKVKDIKVRAREGKVDVVYKADDGS